MDHSYLHGFRLGKAERGLNIHGVEVRQHGKIIAAHQWKQLYRECVFSVSKSFTSSALGIAIEEGILSLDDTVASFFPEKLPKDPSDYLMQATVKDVMTMSFGHETCPIFKSRTVEPECEDWISMIFREPIVHKPGTHFLYSNAGGYLVSAIIQKKTGLTLRDYLTPRLFKPLHIFNPQWESCPQGINVGASGLYLDTEELGRFGQMLLDGGKFEGVQLVPKDYLKLATSNLIDNDNGKAIDLESMSGYGLQFWRNTVPNSYRCDGMYGQYILVLPDYDAVVTLTSHIEVSQNDALRLVWDEVLPLLEKNK